MNLRAQHPHPTHVHKGVPEIDAALLDRQP